MQLPGRAKNWAQTIINNIIIINDIDRHKQPLWVHLRLGAFSQPMLTEHCSVASTNLPTQTKKSESILSDDFTKNTVLSEYMNCVNMISGKSLQLINLYQ